MGKAFQAKEERGCVKTSGTGESSGGGNEKLREDQCCTENTSRCEPGNGGRTTQGFVGQGWCLGLTLTVHHRSELGLRQLSSQ